eukprot:scaffold4193_cov112-Pinguiococcus_pyrenoidosus.AAC.1
MVQECLKLQSLRADVAIAFRVCRRTYAGRSEPLNAFWKYFEVFEFALLDQSPSSVARLTWLEHSGVGDHDRLDRPV